MNDGRIKRISRLFQDEPAIRAVLETIAQELASVSEGKKIGITAKNHMDHRTSESILRKTILATETYRREGRIFPYLKRETTPLLLFEAHYHPHNPQVPVRIEDAMDGTGPPYNPDRLFMKAYSPLAFAAAVKYFDRMKEAIRENDVLKEALSQFHVRQSGLAELVHGMMSQAKIYKGVNAACATSYLHQGGPDPDYRNKDAVSFTLSHDGTTLASATLVRDPDLRKPTGGPGVILPYNAVLFDIPDQALVRPLTLETDDLIKGFQERHIHPFQEIFIGAGGIGKEGSVAYTGALVPFSQRT
ncbi:hypothetical protein JXB02_05555 [Candidatus Woesearchaeota archaeon]|nr:hypothetical protein [Candidatus Woesearchaeota archaeon]